jgi:hypothetical protein
MVPKNSVVGFVSIRACLDICVLQALLGESMVQVL